MAKYLLLRGGLVLLKNRHTLRHADLLESNHQLESRIQEIWQSGSEGGAKPTFVPTPIVPRKNRPVGYGVIRAGVRTDSMIGVTKFRIRKLKTFIAKQHGMIPKCIGGVSDHVHLLVTLPTRLAIAKAVQLIKAGSSAWIHQTFPNLRNFAWQQGYGAFSVGYLAGSGNGPLHRTASDTNLSRRVFSLP